MNAASNLESVLAQCGSTPQLLDILCRQLRASHHATRRSPTAREVAMTMAKDDAAFAESLTDAICLYLQRDASSLDDAGPEFEPLLEMLSVLGRDHALDDAGPGSEPRPETLSELGRKQAGRSLMDWIDRERWRSRPTPEQEKRFALAIWALTQVAAVDSQTFIGWWTERAKVHAGEWPETHFKNEDIEVC